MQNKKKKKEKKSEGLEQFIEDDISDEDRI